MCAGVCLCVLYVIAIVHSYGSKMNGVLGHNVALSGFTGQMTTWVNEINFSLNHAPGAGSIVCPVALQSSMLSLYYDCPLGRVKAVRETTV